MSLKAIQTPKEIASKLAHQIPEYVIQEREAGKGTTLSYISGATVIDILNTTFGYLGWNFEVLKEWKEESIPFFQKKSKWWSPSPENLAKNEKGEEGAWLAQAPVAWVKGRLTVFVEDEQGNTRQIVKEAYGSKSIIGKQSEQEHIFKSAQTDALKKAASLLGIGAQLYRGTDEEKVYYEVLTRPMIWTEELQAESEQWGKLMEVVNQLGWDTVTLNEYVDAYTDGSYINIYTLPVSYMNEFIEYIESALEGEE